MPNQREALVLGCGDGWWDDEGFHEANDLLQRGDGLGADGLFVEGLPEGLAPGIGEEIVG